jgi:hypothetical protein
MKIAKIFPKEQYILYVVTEDGQKGIFDVSPYLNSEVFADLKDESNFKKVRNGKYFVEWKCGADLSADTIEAGWKKISNESHNNTRNRKLWIF